MRKNDVSGERKGSAHTIKAKRSGGDPNAHRQTTQGSPAQHWQEMQEGYYRSDPLPEKEQRQIAADKRANEAARMRPRR